MADIQRWRIITVEIIMFTLTLSVFFLYEKQLDFFQKENEQKVLKEQNTYFKHQISYIQETDRLTKSMHHDMKNHMLSISALAKENKPEEIQNYIQEIYHQYNVPNVISATGNIIIDGLINFKAAVASKQDIRLLTDIRIPSDIQIDDMDITILLGNLLDNAIENTTGDIHLSVIMNQQNLIIRCQNSYHINDERALSRISSPFHGFGLKNMKQVAEKYHGDIIIQKTDDLFQTEILLYLLEEKNENSYL